MKLDNTPPKGTSDWFPEEYKIRKYIFDTWRRVCLRFGYEEYLTPLFENADIYKAKSGEDIGGKELMVMTDKAGRELAIRPEMTPSVTRMVSRIYQNTPKPIRYFSIANYVRNEKPQRGRNREFWQLNADIFGSESQNADLEILQLSLELMLAFNPPKNSFTLNLNNRKLIDDVLNSAGINNEDLKTEVVRKLDKFNKYRTEDDFTKELIALELDDSQVEILLKFIKAKSLDSFISETPAIADSEGVSEVQSIIQSLNNLGYEGMVKYDPSLIRGFDYYDGMIFEVFDNHPDNNRAMFGGGRYNGLARLFVDFDIPAVGFAPGDETTKLFLESWNIVPNTLLENSNIFIPLLVDNYKEIVDFAQKLRKAGKDVEVGLEKSNFKKAFSYADSKKFKFVYIIAEDELAKGDVSVKNMETGEQKTYKMNDLINN